jgi:hypothetical protein
MKQPKQALTQSLQTDDLTGDTKLQQEWVDVQLPPDMSKYDFPISSSFSELDDGTATGPWYILYWLDQYHCLPASIKDQVRELNAVGDSSVYFNDFSDSIAALLNVEFIKDSSTIPVSDIKSSISGYTYSRILDYILTQDSVDLHEELSVKTNNIFKKNMVLIKDTSGIASKISTDAHGRNLITDSQHYIRFANALEEIEALIKENLGPMYRVLKFIQSNISEVEFFKWRGKILVEGSYYDIDFQHNRTDTAGKGFDTKTNTPTSDRLIPEELPIT